MAGTPGGSLPLRVPGKNGVHMKDSLFRKYGPAERSYRIGISLLAVCVLLTLLISWAKDLYPLLTGEDALRGGCLFPVSAGVDQVEPLPEE